MPTYALAYATLPCMGCGKSSVLALDPELYARWIGGEHVQDVWPDWTPGQRELLITGTHPECWAEMFPTCDICGEPDDGDGEDWNGETGNHRSCEQNDPGSLMRYGGAMVKKNPPDTGPGGMPEEDR